MTTQPTTAEATDTPKIKRRPYLNTRPLIDEESLPFVGRVKRKAKNGKYRTKIHYWQVKKGAGPIEGLQYAVDFMDMIKANQSELQTAMLISENRYNKRSGGFFKPKGSDIAHMGMVGQGASKAYQDRRAMGLAH